MGESAAPAPNYSAGIAHRRKQSSDLLGRRFRGRAKILGRNEGYVEVARFTQQLEKALPKMVKSATHEDLKAAFESHLTETEGHAEKCEEIFEMFGKRAKAKRCPAILGIIDEAEDLISENKKSPTINAAFTTDGITTTQCALSSRSWGMPSGTLRDS